MAIPKEYLDSNSDFGFSAIDDEGRKLLHRLQLAGKYLNLL